MTELINELLLEPANCVKKVGNKKYLSSGITKENFVMNNCAYELINCKDLLLSNTIIKEQLIKYLSKTIKEFLADAKSVLIVGLGNRHISADSLGTESLKHVISTRNIVNSKTEVSAISTGVLGLTGIESADVISAVIEKTKPKAIILIDTLCANNYSRLGVNFQISNAGLNPGGGVGNNRKTVDHKTLKSKIVSIGVPLVVYAKNFVTEALESTMHNSIKTENKAIINELNSINFNNLVVTLKDIDLWVKTCGEIIGFAINMALNGYTIEEQKNILQMI